MTESNVQGVFGIKAAILYDRTTGIPFGRYRVLGGSELNLTSESIDLVGGAQRYPWDSEFGAIDAEISLTIREYPNFAFEKHLGATAVENAAETGAGSSAIENKNGTSVVSATTGIASIAISTASEVKTGIYILKAVSATTVDVYFMSSQFDSYQNDILKINATPITVPSSGSTVVITSHGIEITGGSGTVAFVTDDTATFDTRKINVSSDIISVGSASATYPEFGVFLAAQDSSSGRQMYIDVFRCKGVGLPLSFNSFEFAESEISIKPLYDSAKDGVFEITRVTA